MLGVHLRVGLRRSDCLRVPSHWQIGFGESCVRRRLRCPQRHVLRPTAGRLDILLTCFEGALYRKLFHNGQLPLLHFRVDLEQHTFLRLLLMIYYGVALHRLVSGVDGTRLPRLLRHCQLVIHFDGLAFVPS